MTAQYHTKKPSISQHAFDHTDGWILSAMASQSQPAVRERVAFVHRGEASGLDPDAITVKDGHFTVPKFEAVREDRITIQLNGLPVEVVTHIKAFSTLSLRWTSPWAYGTLDPFASRSPPGLHMTYELLDGAQNAAWVDSAVR